VEDDQKVWWDIAGVSYPVLEKPSGEKYAVEDGGTVIGPLGEVWPELDRFILADERVYAYEYQFGKIDRFHPATEEEARLLSELTEAREAARNEAQNSLSP